MSSLHHFFFTGVIPVDAMYGYYNYYLVFLSYVIASMASYVALDISAHLRKPNVTSLSIFLLVGGALVMGAGIWSMHFVGMLAFIMPMPMSYNLAWTGLSMGVAAVTAGIAFLFFMIKKPTVKHYLMSGVILGVAIPTMHYTGMAGMEHVHIQYLPGLFMLSILIAVVAATAALWLAVQSDKGTFGQRTKLKLVSALIMGLAITGMHYTGMAAAVFLPTGMAMHGAYSADPKIMAALISTVVVSIMFVALILSTAKYFMDITLKNKNDFLEAILNNMKDGVIACDSHGKLTMFNETVTKLHGNLINTGMFISELAKKIQVFNPNLNERLQFSEFPLYRALKGEKITDIEVAIKDEEGINHTLLVDGQQLRGENEENLGAVIVFNDISKRKMDEEELKFRATHDILTGLPNRTLLLDRLNQSIHHAKRNNQKVIVVFIDLDNFKFINDALGHTIGDSLLRMVAARFTLLLRSSDTLARIGGDEFVIVLPAQRDIHDVPAFLERILRSISEPYIVDKHQLNITCSMGFSIYPDNGKDTETLLKNADTAMYQAKENGKNTFQFYTGEMQTHVRKRFEVESDLRQALVEEEFILEYQPKLDIKTDKLVGFEALVRWKHPKYGIIPPNDFIPIAEDTGLIIPLGKWVLKTACAQNKAWQDEGLPPLCISVNLSSRQCKDKELYNIIKHTLEETGLSPQYLELELTESLAMSNPSEFIELLTRFKGLGIKTSIDDFGTGYSSLNYLRQFPVNCLKIDQSFIRELETKLGDLSIVKAIVSLGHSLNMKVIAEGVETKKQLQKLQQNDCDEIQGFYLSRPISAENIKIFVKNYI